MAPPSFDPPAEQSILRLPPSLDRPLRRLRRRLRLFVLVDGAAQLVAAAAIWFWVALALDYLPTRVGLPEMPRGVRLGLLLVAAGILAVLIYRLLLRRLLVRIRASSLAVLLERQRPALKQNLVTVVQLAERPGDYSETTAALWRESARRAERELAEPPPRSIFNHQRLASLVVVGILAALSVAALAWLRTDFFLLGVRRLAVLTDQPWPRFTHLEVLGFPDGQRKVAVGGDLVIRVRADAQRPLPPPEQCIIRYRTGDGLNGRATMSREGEVRDGYQYYVFRGKPFQSIRQTIEFVVTGRDYRTVEHRVVAVPPPRLEQLSVDFQPPAYTQSSRRRDAYFPDMAVLEYSSIALIGQGTKPLERLELQAADSDAPLDASWQIVEGGGQFEIELGELQADQQFDLFLIDRDGIRSSQPYSVRIRAKADQVPEVDMRVEGIGSAITPDARIPYRGSIRDDYGIREAWFELVREDSTHAFPVTAAGASETRAALDLRALRADEEKGLVVEPGDVLQITLCASDYCDRGDDRVGRNQTLQLDVVRPDQLLAMLEARELGLRQRLEGIVGELTENRDSLVRVRQSLGEDPPSSGTPGGDAQGADAGEEDAAGGEGSELDAADQAGESGEASAAAPVGESETINTAAGPQLDEAEDQAEAADRDMAEDAAESTFDPRSVNPVRVQRALQYAQRVKHEVLGLAASFAEILLELENNRINSSARQERLQTLIIEPLESVANHELIRLHELIEQLDEQLDNPDAALPLAAEAVTQADQVLARLQAILEEMVEMESYKDLLDLLRNILQEQQELLDETKEQQQEDLLEGLFSEP